MTRTGLPPGFTSRPASLDDAAEIAGVVNAEALITVGRLTSSAAEIGAELQMPSVDLGHDTWVVIDAGGTLAGFCIVFDPSPHVALHTWCGVHPDHYGRGIGATLAEWTETRARASIEQAPPGARVAIGQEIECAHSGALELLRNHGYRPDRYFSRLQVELDAAPPEPPVLEGIAIRPYGGEAELPRLVHAFEDAFRDHWGFVEQPFEDTLREFQAWINTSPRYDPSLWLVAIEGDEIVGLSIAEGETSEDPEMGYISEIGVRRPWRKRGIGTALLLILLSEFRRRGLKRAALDVDAESLTGATRLYEKLGFHLERQAVAMEKELRPGRDLRTQTAEA